MQYASKDIRYATPAQQAEAKRLFAERAVQQRERENKRNRASSSIANNNNATTANRNPA